MENENLKPVQSLPPFKHFCMTIGTLPSSFYASMSYYESLVWLVNYLKETVIPTVNNNAEAVQELQDYVSNYFDNLDVQEEINNKLDEMALDGTLQEIMAQYLQTNAVFGFDNVASLKSSTNLINGSFARTYGYYSLNDGGGAFYKIRTVTNQDVENDFTIIALDDETLVAELIYDSFLNVKQCGLYGDDTHDDTARLIELIPFERLYFPDGTYKITSNLVLDNRVYWKSDYISNYDKLPSIKLYGSSTVINVNTRKSVFKGLCFLPDSENGATNGFNVYVPYTEFYNCNIYNFTGIGITMANQAWMCKYDNCRLEHNGTGIKTNNNCHFTKFLNCYIHANTTGVDMYASEDSGSPILVYDNCLIEDNTSYGLSINCSVSNKVYITNCYFENHAGYSLYSKKAASTPTKGCKALFVSNCRFYVGSEHNGLIYLYWFDNAYFENCSFEAHNNENSFNLINIGASTTNVIVKNSHFDIDNSSDVKPFNQPTKVSYNDKIYSDTLPTYAGAGALAFVGTHHSIEDLKIFDGSYWRNNDGSVYTE